MTLTIYAGSAAITAAIQLSGFSVAFCFQTEKFYDILGGVNFLALAAFSLFVEEPGSHSWQEDTRKIAITIVFVCSRSWLLLFLAWRARERQGDARFDGVKERFWMFLVFWIAQGLWVLIISLPMLFVNASTVYQPNLGVFGWVTIAGFAVAVLLEIVADIQKAMWVSAGRIGTFCQSGVWAFSRHPNYFGEMLQWWCAWIFSYASGAGLGDALWWIGILSPAFTMHILMNTPATGVMQANGNSLKRYYDKSPSEYSRYRKNTSILIPMIGYRHVPGCLKRTVCLDLACYEYRPRTLAEEAVDEEEEEEEEEEQEEADDEAEDEVEAGTLPPIGTATRRAVTA